VLPVSSIFIFYFTISFQITFHLFVLDL